MSEVAAAAGAAPTSMPAASKVRFGADSLVPAIVQDPADGRVLMLAWMDAEALAATLETGEVHFHSRSRDRLWRKGETSGSILRLVSLSVDCDGDALLVTADPAGPTCHRGARSCFDDVGARGDNGEGGPESGGDNGERARGGPEFGGDNREGGPGDRESSGEGEAAPQGFVWLETLWSTIESRVADRPPGSYTTTLLAGGVDAAGRKVTEEATELLLAAKDDATGSTPATRAEVAGEAADLVYHTLVLLAERRMPPGDVIEALRSRHAR